MSTTSKYGSFVETSNVRRFEEGIRALDARASPETCFMIVSGEWGLGKTRLAQHYAAHNSYPYIRVKAAATPHWVLTDLVRELGDVPGRTNEELFAQATGILSKLIGKGTPVAIVIDEVENALRNAEVIETIRDLGDALEVPIILCGREFIGARLKKFPALWSRVSVWIQFQRLSDADLVQVLRDRADATVTQAALDEIRRQTEGRIRLAINAAKRLQAIAKRAGRKLDLPDIKGTDLVKEVTARNLGADRGGEPAEAR